MSAGPVAVRAGTTPCQRRQGPSTGGGRGAWGLEKCSLPGESRDQRSTAAGDYLLRARRYEVRVLGKVEPLSAIRGLLPGRYGRLLHLVARPCQPTFRVRNQQPCTGSIVRRAVYYCACRSRVNQGFDWL